VVYIAGQSMIAFGTVFRGLVAPFKNFFNIKGRFQEMFEGSEDLKDSVRHINEEFKKTGDRDKFLHSMDEVFDRAKNGATAQTIGAQATEHQAAASTEAAGALTAQAAAQERLNAAQAHPVGSKERAKAIAAQTIRPSGVSTSSMPDLEIMESQARQKAMNELMYEAMEDIESRQVLGSGGAGLFTAGPDGIESSGKAGPHAGGYAAIDNLFAMFTGKTLATDLSEKSAKAGGLNSVLAEVSARKASLLPQIDSSDKMMADRARAQLDYYDRIAKDITDFENLFDAAPPVTSLAEFEEFQTRLKQAISDNPSLLAGLESGRQSGDKVLQRGLFDDIVREMHTDTKEGTYGFKPGEIFEGVLGEDGVGPRQSQYTGMGQAS
jgi:hypothetical protein